MEREEIERLKRIDLISYLESMGFKPDWKRGEKAMFFSPLRSEKNPSFYVYQNGKGWYWKDWGTGESGDIIKFIMLYYGVDFKEAIKKLGSSSSIYIPPSIENSRYDLRKDSVEWIRDFYRKGNMMNSEKMKIIRDYFLKRGVRYHSEMKCILVTERKEEKLYIGIPIPFPLKMRGLELREVDGSSRKTWGKKTLWLMKRDPGRFLITESILDALSGEIILDDESISLCSLNGVGNVYQLDDLFVQYSPGLVILALDADEPGQKATREAVKIAKRHSVSVVEFADHIEAGVKDLHKLLMKKEEEKWIVGGGFTKEMSLLTG